MAEGKFFHFPFNLFSPGLCDSIGIWMNGLDADFRKGNKTEYNEGIFCFHFIYIIYYEIEYVPGRCLELRNRKLELGDCSQLNWFICQNATKTTG